MAVVPVVPMGPALAAFGVPVTVTRPVPDNDPIETTGIWVSVVDDLPVGAAFQRREARYLLALPRADVATVPRTTVIVAPHPETGEASTWRVDGIDRADTDHHRVIVVLDSSLES